MQSIYERVRELHGYQVERPYLKFVIKRLEDSWVHKNIFIVEAPTGYGKSSITETLALKAYEDGGKLVVVFPIRTLLEDQFSNIEGIIPETDKVVGKRYMHEHTSPYLIKPITLTTIDTLSLTMFGLAPEDLNKVVRRWREWLGTIEGSLGHYLFSWSSVMLSDLVLDEVHLLIDEVKSLTYLLTLLEHAIMQDQKIVIMSATIPQKVREELSSTLYRYRDKIEWFEFDPSVDERFLMDRLNKNYDINIEHLSEGDKWERIKVWLREGWEVGFRKALVIFNTVREAMKFYTLINNDYKNVLLIHSRFTETDKRRKNKKLKELKKENEYLIVGTQSLEAGINVSSNLLISDFAPANTLVQRFGRFLRYDGEKEGISYVWLDNGNTGERYKVYDSELCKRTYEFLKKRNRELSLHIPKVPQKFVLDRMIGYKELIDSVYGSVEVGAEKREIDEMLSIFTNLVDISKAVEKYFEYCGSFVRQSLIIPVQVKSHPEPIPIDFSIFSKMLESGRVKGCVKYGEGGEVEEPLALKGSIRRFNKAEELIRFIHREGIKSFIIEGEYDGEVGLITGGGELDDS